MSLADFHIPAIMANTKDNKTSVSIKKGQLQTLLILSWLLLTLHVIPFTMMMTAAAIIITNVRIIIYVAQTKKMN